MNTHRSRRRSPARLALALLLTGVSALAPAAAAEAVIADGGWAETNTNLAIRPDSNPQEHTIDGDPLYAIHMPVTKAVARVRLGDFRHGSSCTTIPKARLDIRLHSDGDPWSYPAQIFQSTNLATLPAERGKLTWDFPPGTVLRKGQFYSFRVVRTGCSSSLYTTWANSGPVYSGNELTKCALSATSLAWWRMWHVQGREDNVCGAKLFDASMPTGWLVMKSCVTSGCKQVVTDISTTFRDGPCANGSGGWGFGGQWKFWKHPDPSSPNKYFVCTWDQYAEPGVVPSPPSGRGWHYAIEWPGATTSPGNRAAPRDMYVDIETIDYGALIQRYAPTLRYHEGESFFADRADTATDSMFTALATPVVTDEYAVRWEPLADNDPFSPPDYDLSMNLLKAWYPDDFPYLVPRPELDTLWYNGTDPEADAHTFHTIPYYADHIYGRPVHGGPNAQWDLNDGKLWLQYWFWYFHNEFGVPGAGEHFGDWEMIQVGLDANYRPDVVTYATHENGFSCNWDVVAHGDSPQVYVALGSHASYAHPDDTPLEILVEESRHLHIDDHHQGTGRVDRPTVETVTGELQEIWGWPGIWGQHRGFTPSPDAPRLQRKWKDPSGFYADSDGCPVVADAAAGASRHGAQVALPRPRASAELRDDKIAVRFSLPGGARAPKGTSIRAFAVSADEDQPASSEARRLRSRTGRIRLNRPYGGGPYRVKVHLWDKRLRYGPATTVRLP